MCKVTWKTKIRLSDIKEVEIFILFATIWLSILFTMQDIVGMEKLMTGLNLSSLVSHRSLHIVAITTQLVSILGIFTYTLLRIKLLGIYLLSSCFYWSALTLLLLSFGPFSISVGFSAICATTSLYIYSLYKVKRAQIIEIRQ